MPNILVRTGDPIVHFVRYCGQLMLLFGQTLYWSLTPPFKGERFLIQAKRIGPGSFFISNLVAFFVGMIIALQMAYQMVKLSAEIYIPNILAVAVTRELAPVLTSLIVAGRVGAGITAEIGTMNVTEQIDALKAFAVNPVKFLVVPRFVAMLVMLPLLTIFADLVGIFGGYVICSTKLSISTAMFFDMVDKTLVVKDIMVGLVKTVFFGIIIVMVGCLEGLKVKGGADGVGKSTTVSVVTSFIFIIALDGLFAALLNLFKI